METTVDNIIEGRLVHEVRVNCLRYANALLLERALIRKHRREWRRAHDN